MEVLKQHVKVLYLKKMQTPEAFHFDDFEIRYGKLYYRDKSTSLMIGGGGGGGGKLRSFGEITKILGKEFLRDLGFDIPGGKIMAWQFLMLNRIEEELPSTSDVTKAEDIELHEITENVTRSIENLIAQIEGESLEDLPMQGLLGLDKQLRSIRGLLTVDVAKRFSWKKESRKKSVCSRKSKTMSESMMTACKKTLEKELQS